MTHPIQGPSNYNPYLNQTQQDNAALACPETAATDIETSETHVSSSVGASGSADFGGDLEARVAAMVINHATNRRKQATEQRDGVEKHISNFEQRQISEMHRSADVLRQQANVDLALNLTSSAASTAGAFAGASGAKSSGAAATGAGKDIEAVTKYVDAQYGYLQKEIDIKKTDAQQHREAAVRSLEDINDAKHGADNLEDRAINFLTTATQQRSDTERAMIFRG